MSTISPIDNPENNPRVKAVFDEIRKVRGTGYINNLWCYLAMDADLLENVWAEVRDLMATETLLDFKTKEMVYLAVSIANACQYCIHSHTAAAKARGMTDPEHAELLRIVMTAGKTNHLLNAMQIPVDEVFDMERE